MLKCIATLLLLAFSSPLFAQPANPMSWLAGSWQMEAGTSLVVEEWHVVNDSTLHGRSFFIKDKKDTIPQETIELSYRGGHWYYIPTVQGQNNNQPVHFRVIFHRGTEFISENPEHDFPQRISYRLWKNNLFASIEGKKNGVYRKENFNFIRP